MDIKLRKDDKKLISNSEDVYAIMQRILLRDNKIDREKEHFWIIGMNLVGYILYIELISLGSVKMTVVEPMNVFRVAVMKNASRVVAIHNHPSGDLTPSDEDLEVTDRLIQVGQILGIRLDDHMIISTTDYLSFRNEYIMDRLEESLKFVPTYELEQQIQLAKQIIEQEKQNALVEKKLRQKIEQQMISAVHHMNDKNITKEQIAEILHIPLKDVQRLLRRKRSV